MPAKIWRTRWWPVAAIIGVLIEGAPYIAVAALALYGAYRLIGG